MAGVVRGVGGAARLIGGAARAVGQQVPDEVLRLGRRATGGRSLRDAIEGRHVMVTGASSGIGLAAAMKIAQAGGTVLLVARTPEKLESTREAIEQAGGEAHVHRCDLSDFEDIDRMAAEVLERHGHVDILVNNAGRSIRRSLALSYERFHDFERTIQLNYLGAVRLILCLVPPMRERRYGQIVNISSIGVQTNTPRFSAYVASKAALDAFSRCVAPEMMDDNVTITTIHMPLVRTPMIAPTGMYKSFPTLSPDEAAGLITDAIIHRPKRVATPLGNLGQILYAANPKSMDVTLGAAYKLFPDSAAARGDKKKVGPANPEGDTDDDGLTRSAQVFAQMMRGVHW
ncbi:MAG: SDR family NAD(P)-dependent oxidoreductase [Solirubrobacteraceae bacterium MAG38_C4-C5]|nr:SDR family NAD(P)-dependent oxidoreductase [Candidatus Siliceabacter maunaloa]